MSNDAPLDERLMAFISSMGKSLTTSQQFYFGVAIVTSILILLPFVIFRFDRLLRVRIFRIMFRWGKPSWGFPASRVGVTSGCLLGLVLGGMAIDHNFSAIHANVWLILLATTFAFLSLAAIRDYKLYKRNKKPVDSRQR